MEPIISPWVIYGIEVLRNIDHLMCITAAACCVYLFYVGVQLEKVAAMIDKTGCRGRDSDYWDDESKNKFVQMVDEERNKSAAAYKWGKRVLWLFFICIIVKIFIPSEEKMYLMLASSMVTPDNLAMGKEQILDFARQLAEIIKGAEGME